MHCLPNRLRRCLPSAVIASVLLCVIARATDVRSANSTSPDELWREGIRLVEQGNFTRAHDAIKQISAGGQLTDKVRTWLAEYEEKQAKRKELDRADFDKYVGYAGLAGRLELLRTAR